MIACLCLTLLYPIFLVSIWTPFRLPISSGDIPDSELIFRNRLGWKCEKIGKVMEVIMIWFWFHIEDDKVFFACNTENSFPEVKAIQAGNPLIRYTYSSTRSPLSNQLGVDLPELDNRPNRNHSANLQLPAAHKMEFWKILG